MPPAVLSFLRAALAVQGPLWFHTNVRNFISTSVKNAIGNLIGMALTL